MNNKGDATIMKDKVTISLFELAPKYPTDDSARIFLEEQRWHGQPVCPLFHQMVETQSKML